MNTKIKYIINIKLKIFLNNYIYFIKNKNNINLNLFYSFKNLIF